MKMTSLKLDAWLRLDGGKWNPVYYFDYYLLTNFRSRRDHGSMEQGLWTIFRNAVSENVKSAYAKKYLLEMIGPAVFWEESLDPTTGEVQFHQVGTSARWQKISAGKF
jgi:hypothetical protein